MPDLWMDVDAGLSEVPINLLPLTDDTDFKTREESVVYNQAGLDLVWNFVTTAGALTQTAVTPTTGGGDYDWTNQGNGMYTIEIPASGGASINNDTEGFGWFTGFATGILPWRGPVIGFRASGLNDKLIDSAYSTTRGLAGTALPDAAADGAGGLPISDAGGLDLDAQIGTDIDAILADTNELQTDDYPTLIAALPTAAENRAEMDSNSTQLAAIVADTNELQADDTPGALAAIDAKIDTIDGIVDAILVDTGTTIPGTLTTIAGYLDTEVAAILADTNELQTDWTNGGRLDLLIDAIKAITDALPDSGALSSLATAAKLKAYVQLLARKDAAIATDNATELSEINNDEGSGAGAYDNATESQEAIRDRGDADWSSGAAANPNMLLEAEINTVSSQTEFTLASGSDVDDAYKDQTIVIYDDSNSDYPSVRTITAYTGATKTVTIDSAPDFTMGTDDSVKIFVTAPGSTAPTAAQVADAVWDEARSGHVAGGSFGETMGTVETNIDNCDAPISTVDTVVDAIKAVTDNIPDSGALSTIDGKIDTIDGIVDAILVDTGTTIPGTLTQIVGYLDTEIAAILADTDEIQAELADGGRLDLLIDAIKAVTDALPDSGALTSLATAAALTTVDTVVDAIKVVTDNLPDSGALSDLAAILEDTGTTIPGLIAALENLSAAEVNAEVVDALATDTYAEPGQGAPAATASLAAKLNYLYKFTRNKKIQSATELDIYNDAGDTVDQKSTKSDDGSNFTSGEIVSGP